MSDGKSKKPKAPRKMAMNITAEIPEKKAEKKPATPAIDNMPTFQISGTHVLAPTKILGRVKHSFAQENTNSINT